MVYVPVHCAHCQGTKVIKAGKQANGTQRYRCQNEQCPRRIFLLQYQDRGRAPEVRRQVVDMALNGSGVRDTARVLRISPTTVIAVLKNPPHCNPSTPRSYRRAGHATATSAASQDAKPKWMKCGVLSGTKIQRGGYGTQSNITRGESWPM
jgi:transposase-like protein